MSRKRSDVSARGGLTRRTRRQGSAVKLTSISNSLLKALRLSHPYNAMASTTNLRKRNSIHVIDAKVAVDLATAQTYSEVSENVFLFVPNLIGKFLYTPPATCYLTPIRQCRILPNHSRWSCAPFHELPPEILYIGLWDLLLAGRCGRTRSQGFEANIQVRSCIRYGYRPVRVPLLLLRVAYS